MGGIEMTSVSSEVFNSRKLLMPMEDCESFACAMKKSVSSSTARSGDVDDDDSEGASLENRAGCRERGIGGKFLEAGVERPVG